MPAAGHRQTEPAARTDISRALPAIVRSGAALRRYGYQRRLSVDLVSGALSSKTPAARHRQRSARKRLLSARVGHSRARPRFPFPDCLHGGHSLLCRQPEASALIDHPWLAGVGYALVVYGFMYWIVMPLSRLHRRPVTLSGSMTAIVTHIICVGLPISLTVHRFTRR